LNPIHLDPEFARRTEVGLPIVHGVHAVLWALEELLSRQVLVVGHIKAEFVAPLYLGDLVHAEAMLTDAGAEITIRSSDAVAIKVRVGSKAQRGASPPTNDGAMSSWPVQAIEQSCDSLSLEARNFPAEGDLDRIGGEFPILSKSISPRRVAALCAVSRIVGMVNPGLHSLLKGFSLDLLPSGPHNSIGMEAQAIDANFRLVKLAVRAAGISGRAEAFLRHPPAQQPSMNQFAATIGRNEFDGANVLVVGGSRGLGEAIAKACAAGGARVCLTWAVGERDAQRVRDEIRHWGGDAECIRLDIREEIASQLVGLPAGMSHFYYCASPPMQRRRVAGLSESLLAELLEFHVDGLYRTSLALAARAQGTHLRGYFPSTTSIERPARGLMELSVAKAAGEALSIYLGTLLRGIDMCHSRLPRLRTDQTATVIPTRTTPMLDIVVPLVRAVQTEQTPGSPTGSIASK